MTSMFPIFIVPDVLPFWTDTHTAGGWRMDKHKIALSSALESMYLSIEHSSSPSRSINLKFSTEMSVIFCNNVVGD